MTNPLGHIQPPAAEEADFPARGAGRALGVAQAAEGRLDERVYPQPWRLGRLLRAGTLVTDGVALASALLVVGAVHGSLAPVQLGLLTGGWLLVLRAWGAYRRGLGYSLGAEAKTIVLAALTGSLVLLALGPEVGVAPSRSTAVALAAPVAFLAFGRLALRVVAMFLRRRRALVRRVLVVGHGRDADELLENIAAWPDLGVEVVGICADTTESTFRELPVLGLSRSCNLVARDLGVRTVILAPEALGPADCSKLHSDLLDSRLEVIVAPNVAHVEAARLSPTQFGGLPLLQLQQRERHPRDVAKRVFDLLVATVLIVLLTPLLVLLAALIRLDSAGPAFFRQIRIGKGGASFELWKFRTMRPDAEAHLEELRSALGDGPLFKLRDDPRVTRAGRLLRRTSLDELPQLWNVLLGEMSLVGPRPALPNEVAEFDDLTLRRLRVRPGITGLWQVSGRADASFATYSRMDAFYAENWTLLGDLRILLKTIPVVFASKGAY